jgi:hypothetical protein
MKKFTKIIGGMILAGLMAVPAMATANPASPGTVNYVEGKVDLGNEALNAKSVGSTTLEPGQSLITDQGKVEMLLTPGVFVRVGDNSVMQLVSGNLTNTEVRLDKGSALVEVDEIHKDNNLLVADNGATTKLEKTGLYEFDADKGAVMVFKGKADVREGEEHETVKSGHEVELTAAKLKSTKFDKDKYESSDLYRFSSLRSQYIGEASVDAAQDYVGAAWAPGWFWDPWFSAYTFFPGAGFMYSPFGWGWGFYSPAWIGYYGVPYGYYRGGVRYYAHGNVRAVPARVHASHFATGGVGFHGGGAMAFHSGGGGFHGGGFHR